MATLSGPHRDPRAGGPPTSLVVLLHGRGASGDDLIGLADTLGDSFPNSAFHSPNAPNQLGGFGYTWYPLDLPGGRPEGLREIEPVVNEYVDGLLASYALPSTRCLFIGFSQGSILSIHVAPRRSEPIAGVVGFSGAMFTGDTLESEIASKPPFVLVHGADDQVLGSHESEAAGRKLDGVGVPVSVHILPGLGHGIDHRGLSIASEFMQRVLETT